MSTKPCPSCGKDVSTDSRFCGHCGATTDVEVTRKVPTTVDEATRDPDPETGRKPDQPTKADFGKTLSAPGSVDRVLASLEPAAPPPAGAALPTMIGRPLAASRNSALPTPLASPTPFAPPDFATNPPGLSPGVSALPTAPMPAVVATALGVPAPRAAEPTRIGPAVQSEPKIAAPPSAPDTTKQDVPKAESSRGPVFGRTMLGGSITAADVIAESTRRMQQPGDLPPPENVKQNLKTIVGVAAIDRPTDATKPSAGAEPPPAPPPADPQALRPAFKTMMGVAVPGIAPVRDSERSLQGAPPSAQARPLGTLVGGIAAPTPRAQRPMEPVPPIVPAPAPLVDEPLPPRPKVVQAKKDGLPAPVVAGIIMALIAILAVIGTLVFFRATPPLTAKARLDESGKESLEVGCPSCPDGTSIALGASKVTVTGGAAILPLPAPLKIGENDLEIAIDRPGGGRDEKVKVHVPIAYRVKADLTTLSMLPPTVTVRVEATPGTEVTVDGKSVALDANGKGSYPLDVSADALGPSDDQKALDRKIAFSVKRKGTSSREDGSLVVRAAIVPLHMDAPGGELYTELATANVAGQTKPGGTLTVDGQNVPLDANGRYAIRAELPSEGEKTLTITASAPPLAPRTIRAKVIRVPAGGLEAEAKTLDQTTPLGFDAYGPDPASKLGQLVVISGEILEIRTAPGYTVMVVEEKKSCGGGSGCVVRLEHGEEVKASRGDTVRAYGHVAGTVAWNGKTVPSVTGSLLIATPGHKK